MNTAKKIGFALLIFTSVAWGGERDDINQVLKELQYTKEVVKKLKNKNRNNKAKVRFNYDALLAQLQTSEQRIKEYLNLNIKALHVTPPKPINGSLYKVRKN